MKWHNKHGVILIMPKFVSYLDASFSTHQVFDEMFQRTFHRIVVVNNHTKM